MSEHHAACQSLRRMMHVFSKTTEYALRAAVYLSEQAGELRTALQVAEATQVPPRYASRVLQLLGDAGVANSFRGPTGGFILAKPASDISLLDVVRAVEPVERITTCPLGLVEHADELCPLHKAMDRVIAKTEEILAATSVASVMEQRVVPLGLSALSAKSASNGKAG